MKNLEYIDELEKTKYIEYNYTGEKPFIDNAINFLQEAKDKGYKFTNINFNNFNCTRKISEQEFKEHQIQFKLRQINALKEDIEKLKKEI